VRDPLSLNARLTFSQGIWFWAPFGFITFFKIFFFGVPHLATYIFFKFTRMGALIDPGMALIPFPSSILNETRFKPTTF